MASNIEALKVTSEKPGDNTVLRWMKGGRRRVDFFRILDQETIGGVAYTDGNRMQGDTAAATIGSFEFLGRYATVMDAEPLGIAVGCRLSGTVATDSQAAIGRIINLQFELPRSWIEEQAMEAQEGKSKALIWVKGHSE